jgi:DNA-binding NarL/FixJ family response regulator
VVETRNLHDVQQDLETLSPLERDLLTGYAGGLSRKELALRVRRSPHTVSHALTVAKEKLGARSVTEAAVLISVAGQVVTHA